MEKIIEKLFKCSTIHIQEEAHSTNDYAAADCMRVSYF